MATDEPEIKSIDITPDGMFLAAFNTAEFLLQNYEINELGIDGQDPGVMSLTMDIFKKLVENKSLIEKSSWLERNQS